MSGNNAAQIINEEAIDPNSVFILAGRPSWSLDFYTRRITPILDLDAGNIYDSGKEVWVFLYESQLGDLKSHDITWKKKLESTPLKYSGKRKPETIWLKRGFQPARLFPERTFKFTWTTKQNTLSNI